MTAPALRHATRPALPPVTGSCTIEASDLARLRLAISPVWETVASLQVLTAARPGLHEPWARTARERVRAAGLDLDVLLALVPGTRHIADFVTPTPHGREGTMTQALTDVREADLDIVRADAAILLSEGATPVAAEILHSGLADPASLRARAADGLEAYFEVAVRPVWERLRRLALADIAWRLDRIAAGGLHGVLAALHPRARLAGERLVIEHACRPGPATTGAGLVLVPCAFAFPSLIFLDMPGHAPTASYGPRGVGVLWQESPDAAGSPLAALVGRTRASALSLLDLPMTTSQLACHLDVTPSTASEHLQVLARAGAVAARRRGREVLYARTGLGDDLVTGGTGGTGCTGGSDAARDHRVSGAAGSAVIGTLPS